MALELDVRLSMWKAINLHNFSREFWAQKLTFTPQNNLRS